MASTPPVGATPVTGAIRKASQATGAGFDYLLATAKVESDLDPNLTMGSSSATGLFQFIDQTWLGTLKQAGPAFGYGNYADAITLTSSGRYLVEDPALRNEIMQLRKDPAANAMMGGAFTQQNAAVMASRLGRMPTEGELYIGHFFGPYAGAKAIALAQSYPNANAAEIFPAAAQANRSIFYDSRGYARSVASVCAELTRRYQAARSDTSALAATVPPVPPAPIPSVASTGLPLSLAPPAPAPVPADTGSIKPVASPAPMPAVMGYATDTFTPVTDPGTKAALTRRADAGGMFHSLFQTGERREAVSPAIRELWTTPGRAQSPGAAAPAAGRSRDNSAGQESSQDFVLGLFRDSGSE
jgi:hypothetical protein